MSTRAGKRKINKKKRKQKVDGIVPGLSLDCPGIFPEISREILFVFSLYFQETGNEQTNLTPTHSRDNPEKMFMFISLFVLV